MRRLVTTSIIALCCAAVPRVADASDVSASARVSSDVVEVGATFQYVADASVQGADRIRLVGAPTFEAMKVVGQSRAPQLVTINGVTQRRLSVRYSLRGTRVGEATIRPPVFRVGDREVKPDPITVKFVEPGSAPKPKVEKSGRYFIETTVEPKDPYVGQQVTLRYDLYVDGTQLDISPTETREPSLDEFWIEPLTDRVQQQQRMVSVRGNLMKRTPLWSYALFPLETGPATIEKAQVELVVGAFFRRGKSVTVASDDVELDVRPLPPDAPTGFSEGNVGNYGLTVRTDQSKTRVGRAITVDVTITGEGQIGRVKVPELPAIAGVRVSDVDEERNQTIRSLTVGGTKTVSYTLTPLEEGRIEIPALDFTYFDPEGEKYVTETSDPISVSVASGELPPAPIEADAVATRDVESDEDLVANLLARLEPPTSEPEMRAVPDPARFGWLNWVFVVAAFLVFAWVAFGRRMIAALRRASPERQRRAATTSAVARLEVAADDPAAVAMAIRTGLHEAYGIPRGLVTSADLVGAFVERDLDTDVARELAAVLTVCEEAQFSPDSNVDTTNLTDRAREALGKLEKSGAGGSNATTVALVFTLTCALLVCAPTAAKVSVGDAVAAQSAGDWAAATKAWRQIAADHQRVPDVWYNLGTSASHAGDYGTARWALERATYLSPWNDAAENNRDVAERIVRLQSIEQSRTGRTLDGDETLFWWQVATHVDPRLAAASCTAFWLLGAFAIRVRRRTDSAAVRDGAFVGLVIAALLAVFSTAALAARNQVLRDTRPVVVVTDIELREGPNAAASRKTTPPAMVPGTLLRATDVRDDWTKIIWAGGAGWTRSDAVRSVR